MRAAYYERIGAAREVLHVGELPDPQPGPGEVRVRVAVAGLNPSDVKSRSGWRGPQMPFPRVIPQNDGAGTIDAVGPGVTQTRIGERVWVYEAQRDGRAFGTAAQFVVVPAQNAVPLPANAGFELGASLGVPAMTAHRCLFVDGAIQGQTILVHGGGGAVGNAAIQLARWAGARVIATVSREEQAAAARTAGATIVVNRRSGDVATSVLAELGGPDVDRVIEVAFEENLETNLRVLRTNGVIAAYASGPANSTPAIPFSRLMVAGITVHFVLVYVMPDDAHRDAARDVNAAIAQGALRPFIAHTFSLDEIVAAHELQEAGTAVGNIVVRVD